MYLAMCFVPRYMEISMCRATKYMARYMEISMYLAISFVIEIKITEITSITDKFCQSFVKLAKLTKVALFHAKRKLPLTSF